MTPRSFIPTTLALFTWLAVASGGCSKENNVSSVTNNTNSTVNNITQLVGPAGATVEGPGGSQLVVPPGALSEEFELTIGELPMESLEFPLPEGSSAVSTVYGFLPHGQLFALDARISFDHTANSPADVRLLRASPGSDWQEVALSDVTPDRVVRDASTFSFYVAVVDSQGGSGGSGGGGGSGGSGVGGSGIGGNGGSGFDGGQCKPESGPCAGATDTTCCDMAACEFVVSEWLCAPAS